MLCCLCACVLFAHASALFFHERSSIVLSPSGRDNASFGYSLGYQHGDNPSLVIGAPLYDITGRVFQESIRDILSGRTACDPLEIDFAALNITYDRTFSPEQHFYLGASIAATEKFFVTIAPLRTAYGKVYDKDGKIEPFFGAYGACFIYDNYKTAHACRDYGLAYFLENNKSVTEYLYGGSGWSSLVDEDKKRIIISKSFGMRDVLYGSLDPDHSFTSMRAMAQLQVTTTKSITNFGKAMTLGNYFHKNKRNMYYAFSSRDENGIGAIDFYRNDWSALRRRLEDNSVGSMFGAALCSADVTGDGLADLFVGAPARVQDARSYDRGAVHVYTKTKTVNLNRMVLKLTIWGVKDGGRFGTSLSSNDVDGDSYPEIFISAPFYNSGAGALYIVCGFETHELLAKDTKTVLVSELKRIQRIEKETHKTFGFSLQTVTDFNDNGSDELGVGAPGNSKVTLFSGLRSITVKATSKFSDTVLTDPDSRSSFLDFYSCVNVDLPPKPKIINMKLLVQNVLSGIGTFNNSENSNYEINLATDKGKPGVHNTTDYCRQICIVNASYCKVTSTVSTVENIQESEEFQSTWVTLSSKSNLTASSQFECSCPNTSCAPELQTEVQWSGRFTDGKVADYIVGSSQSEMVTVAVRNVGTMSCSSCAIVRVSGQMGLQLQCQHTDDDRQYKCDLPFVGNNAHTIEIQLLTDKLSNQDRNLTIDVEVRKNCDVPEPAAVTSLTIPYSFTSVVDNVVINGTSMDREISDTEVHDETEELIIHEQTYTILNNRSFIWEDIGVNISGRNKSYIQNFRVTIKQTEEYAEFNGTKDFSWHRTLTLAPYSTIKVTISTTIIKKEAEPYLRRGQITISSKLSFDLFPDTTKNKNLTTILTFKTEKSVWHNKMQITIISLVAALLCLVGITIILYKQNFFRRKIKEQMKQEVRRRSIRRESSRRRTPGVDDVEEHTLAKNTGDLPVLKEIVSENQSSSESGVRATRASLAQPDQATHAQCDYSPRISTENTEFIPFTAPRSDVNDSIRI